MLSLILTPYRRLVIASLLLSINLGVTNKSLPSKIGCKNAFTEKPITSYILRIIAYCRGTSHAARHTPEAGCASAVFSTHGRYIL